MRSRPGWNSAQRLQITALALCGYVIISIIGNLIMSSRFPYHLLGSLRVTSCFLPALSPSLPPEQEALADKYSQFDPVTGEPTHAKDGNVLEGKVHMG